MPWWRVGAVLLFLAVLGVDLFVLTPQGADLVGSPAVAYLLLLVLAGLAAILLRLLLLIGPIRRRLGSSPAPQGPFPIKTGQAFERYAFSRLGAIAFVIVMLIIEALVRAVVGSIWRVPPPGHWLLLIGALYLMLPIICRVRGRFIATTPSPRALEREFRAVIEGVALWGIAGLVLMCFAGWLLPLTARLPAAVTAFFFTVLVLAALLGAFIRARRSLQPLLDSDRALCRGDYEGALKSLEAMQPGFWPALLLERRGTILFWQGRLKDAEKLLRESLGAGRDDLFSLAAPALDRLGYVFLAQECFDEARQAFSASVRVAPRRGQARAGLGEILLRQASQPQQAIKLLRRGVELSRRSPVLRFLHRRELGEMWANLGWALEILEYYDEAGRAVDSAFREGDRRFQPGLAAVHYRVGVILALRDLLLTAKAHFKRAMELDPHGLYGEVARYALQQVEETGSGGRERTDYDLEGIDDQAFLGVPDEPRSIRQFIRQLVDQFVEHYLA